MKVMKVEIGEHRGFPFRDLKVYVESLPANEDFVWTSVPIDERSTLYVGTCGDYVRQLVHSPENETGFGGGEFKLHMADGSVKVIKGPWSSRAEVTNEYYPQHRCCEVVLYEPSYYSGFAGYNVREAKFRELAAMAGARVVDEDTHRFYATV